MSGADPSSPDKMSLLGPDNMSKKHLTICLPDKTSADLLCINPFSPFTDLSTLNLGNIDKSRDELDLVLNVSSTDKLGNNNLYCTIDNRRVSSKHKKNQLDRYKDKTLV